MASSARAQFIAQPVEDAFDFSKMGDPDDWVSLFLSDVGLDVAEEAHPTSVSSLSSFPLPDLDDVDFISLEGSATSHGVSSDSALCPSEMLQEPFCPRLQQIDALPCPNFSQNCDPAKDNRISHSPESGLSHTGPECQEIDTSIPNMDSCSDEDSFYFFVSDICSEDTSTAETEPYNLINTIPGSDSIEHSKDSAQTKIDLLQSLNSEQNCPIGSDKALVSMGSAASSRKRKHLDQATRSSTSEGATDTHNEQSSEGTEVKDEEDERRRARLMRNRESAQLSRQRKKIYVDELEEKIKTMASTIAELNNRISLISAENINLRRQLGMFGPSPGQAGGLSTAMPWMGAYPPGAMMGSRYMMPGSQVPLVPIPKWKSQQSTTLKKSRKPKLESEKGGMEEASKKTKKAAGVAVAGLFMFVFILLPINFQFMGLGTIIPKESKVWPTTPSGVETNKVVLRAGGRVLTGLTEESKFSSNEFGSGIDFRSSQAFKTREPDPQQVEKPLLDANGADQKHRYRENASTPLAATLFVPRNDQLVRIEGNLIINSVLAGFEAADSLNQSDKKTARERTLYDRTSAVDANLKAVALKAAPKEQGALVELQRALAGRLRFDLDASDIKSIEEDGSLHQWFIEDFTGPIFSSGMCTEIFQFETSPVPSSTSPGSASHVRKVNDLVENETACLQENAPRKAGRPVPHSKKGSSYAIPLAPIGHKVMFNSTSSNNRFKSSKGQVGAENDYAEQKHVSSVVVSVLAGPELGRHSKLTGGHKMPRIYVVVLVDSIKYVTYSCMLPSAAAKSHYEMVVA